MGRGDCATEGKDFPVQSRAITSYATYPKGSDVPGLLTCINDCISHANCSAIMYAPGYAKLKRKCMLFQDGPYTKAEMSYNGYGYVCYTKGAILLKSRLPNNKYRFIGYYVFYK